jgi:hypothetical protein
MAKDDLQEALHPTLAFAAEQARRITTLEAENAALRTGLEPMANMAGGANMNDPIRDWLTVAHLAQARALVAQHGDKTDG